MDYLDAGKNKTKIGEYASVHPVWYKVKDHMLEYASPQQKKNTVLPQDVSDTDFAIMIAPDNSVVTYPTAKEFYENVRNADDGTIVIILFKYRPMDCINLYSLKDGKKTPLGKNAKVKAMKEIPKEIKDILYDLQNTRHMVFFNLQGPGHMVLPNDQSRSIATLLKDGMYTHVAELPECTRDKFTKTLKKQYVNIKFAPEKQPEKHSEKHPGQNHAASPHAGLDAMLESIIQVATSARKLLHGGHAPQPQPVQQGKKKGRKSRGGKNKGKKEEENVHEHPAQQHEQEHYEEQHHPHEHENRQGDYERRLPLKTNSLFSRTYY